MSWDGRLHNAAELRRRFPQRLPDDASLALAVFAQGGESALESLIGDWSGAFWDASRLTLVLASDYTGVRPLYYCCSGDLVMWSASLAELLSRLPVTPPLDEDYAAEFLACGGSCTRTPYESVRVVPPGTAVRVTRRSTELRPIWQPRKEAIEYRDERDYADQFRHLFEEAVAVRLQTPGPVFAELSGGLDSSAIVCMAHRLIEEGCVESNGLALVHYPHPDSPDAHFYRIVERELGLEAVHLNTRDYPYLGEEAPGRTAPMWWEGRCHALARLLDAAGSSVFLTGRLGDLVMGNYLDDSIQVADLLRTLSVAQACSQAWAWCRLLNTPIYSVLGRSLASCVTGGELAVTPQAEDSLRPSFRERTHEVRTVPPGTAWKGATPSRTRHLQMLRGVIESRAVQTPEPLRHVFWTHPYTHRPLVEFMMAIPPSVVCGPGEPRRLMRAALADLLPKAICARRSKASFAGAFRDSLHPIAAGLLESAQALRVAARGWVDAPGFHSRLRRFLQGLECNEGQLRQMILLELWLRAFESGRTTDERAVTASCGVGLSPAHRRGAPTLVSSARKDFGIIVARTDGAQPVTEIIRLPSQECRNPIPTIRLISSLGSAAMTAHHDHAVIGPIPCRHRIAYAPVMSPLHGQRVHDNKARRGVQGKDLLVIYTVTVWTGALIRMLPGLLIPQSSLENRPVKRI